MQLQATSASTIHSATIMLWSHLLVCTQGGEFCRCQQVLSLIDQLDDDEKMLEEIRSIFKVRHPGGMPASP